MSTKHGKGNWSYCYWCEKYDRLHEVPRQEGTVEPGILMLPPPFSELTLADGLWNEVNAALGTLFDFAEEDDLEVDQLAAMIPILIRYVERIDSEDRGVHRLRVGQTNSPQKEGIYAEMPKSDYSKHLQTLVDFLGNAQELRKSVVIAL